MTTVDDLTTITHTASGATAQIHAFGATVLSFKGRNGRENLFVSKKAVFDGSKAIRGGIPLCFPIFGPAAHGSTMPQHVRVDVAFVYSVHA
jgi:glucose-6-phosphate 1-epimerase